MNETTRTHTRRGHRRAPTACANSCFVSRYPSVIAFSCVLSIAAALAIPRPLHADDNSTPAPGIEDYVLEDGFPNPSRGPGPYTGAVNANQLLGADRFYNAGYTGTRAVMANIEAGYIWNGHETLTHVGLIPTFGAAGEFDRHATVVGMLMGGRLGGASPGEYQRGIGYGAQLYSGAIATSWAGTRFTTSFFFDWNNISTWGPYRSAFLDGIQTPGGPRTADVVNSSWAGSIGVFGTDGNDQISGTLDALANSNTHTLFVAAAGNNGPGPNQVPAPASGFNNLTVAALTSDGSVYDLPSSFTSGGPNNYSDPNRTVTSIRQVVDIAAPGENVSGAYYGGETGGNGPTLSGPPDGPLGAANWYTHSTAGTSFAAPTVAGGAALLYDASYANFPANPNARDARVIKAVLMNSAAKTRNWNNGQTPNPNGLGGVVTTQGLDNNVGAGRIDLNHAFDQLLNGTTDVPGTLTGALGAVHPTGWDYGLSLQGTNNDYLIDTSLAAGSKFTGTLTWYRDRTQSGLVNFNDVGYDNLDLELWRDVAGVPTDMISTSDSRYNNTEHFSFSIPSTGQYTLRVLFKEVLFSTQLGLASDNYGLAWSTVAVPEPAAIALLLVVIPLGCGSRPRRRS